jgi:hypothetical protein
MQPRGSKSPARISCLSTVSRAPAAEGFGDGHGCCPADGGRPKPRPCRYHTRMVEKHYGHLAPPATFARRSGPRSRSGPAKGSRSFRSLSPAKTRSEARRRASSVETTLGSANRDYALGRPRVSGPLYRSLLVGSVTPGLWSMGVQQGPAAVRGRAAACARRGWPRSPFL